MSMEMKWRYFIGACLVVGAALLKAGAPVFGIVAGMAVALCMNLLRNRNSQRGESVVKAR